MYFVFLALTVLGIGLLVALHEFGHFIVAKKSGVKVKEFAVGIGPNLFTRQCGETKYSFKLLPLGGYCAMEDETGTSNDSRSFGGQPLGKKIGILAAGPCMNAIVGVLLIVAVMLSTPVITLPCIGDFTAGAPQEIAENLEIGDWIIEVDGRHIWTWDDIMSQFGTGDTHDITVKRDGETVTLTDIPTVKGTYQYRGKDIPGNYGVMWLGDYDITVADALHHAIAYTCSFTRNIGETVIGLFTGSVKLSELTSVVGISDAVADIGVATQESVTERTNSVWDGVSTAMTAVTLYVGIISLNLAIMNLIPLPALDGGQIVIAAINAGLRKTVRREIPPKVITVINGVCLVALMGFMGIMMVRDFANILLS